eukprot:COSAG01_NODE_7608_length_3129_cov_1.233333_1_plen_74_part_00
MRSNGGGRGGARARPQRLAARGRHLCVLAGYRWGGSAACCWVSDRRGADSGLRTQELLILCSCYESTTNLNQR